MHVIYFDHTCALCQKTKRFVESIDKRKIFSFLHLEGSNLPRELLSENTLVLLENGVRIWIRGRAVFRILWLVGGWWKLLGWLCFVPVGVDLIYRLVSRLRHRL
jgi:predicted DCC family thiol-disulfide oxidoreductase YuxK